ncbi:hypothetical protein [Denitrobaculum tricleocarpae]|uniref:Uncharacterized protein n=1 Tax=Denitrobaculum tricleocarpae TaxID=2591009 RepID=A0A545SYN2_9PROT|nr:hypothetical protein [Denitrobaculum tricleocarpae]TQV70076.1 hypothetical protein FKG95_28345 [Denitrobaculum tricleocarpae]
MTTETSEVTVLASAPERAGESHLAWSAVLGGAVVAVAISAFLLQFGTAVGLSAGAPLLDDGTVSWNVLVAGLWVVWVALASAAAGGYLAGRMRSRWVHAPQHEVEFRDGIHGLVVWAVASLVAGFSLFIAAGFAALSDAPLAAGNAGDVSELAERIAGNASIITAFATAAAAAIGAAAAWFAAKLGGEHRDQEVDVNTLVPFYKK